MLIQSNPDFPAPDPIGGSGRIVFSSYNPPGIFVRFLNSQKTIRIRESGSLPSWSPNGNQIAFIEDNSIKTMDPNGDNVQTVTDEITDLNFYIDKNLLWSPDSQSIAFSHYAEELGGEIFIIDLATGDITTIINFPSNEYNPIWSQDSKKVVFLSDYGGRSNQFRPWVIELATGDLTLISYEESRELIGSTAADTIIFKADNTDTWYRMKSDGTQLQGFDQFGGLISPDGTKVIYLTGFDTTLVYIWDILTNNLTFISEEDVSKYAIRVAWAPDSKLFVLQGLGFFSTEKTYLVDAASGEMELLFEEGESVSLISWEPIPDIFRDEENTPASSE